MCMHQYDDLRITLKKSKERLITLTRNRTTTTRKQKRDEEQLHDYFKLQTDKILHENTWTRRRKGNCKRETEPPLIAAQKYP